MIPSVFKRNVEKSPTISCNYCIKCNEKEFFFAEIEFYYWDKNHWNEKWNRVTYPRICNPGKLFYHLSGIDICFDSYYNERNLNDEARFGGILIRAIRSEDGIVIAGPLNCMLSLLNECRTVPSKSLVNNKLLPPPMCRMRSSLPRR